MKLNKTLTALAIGASFGLSGQAFANGTASGTTIENTASLAYKVNTVPQEPARNSIDFKVATRVDFTLSTPDTISTKVTPGGENYVLEYTLTNTGNSTFDFSLAATQMTGGNVNTLTDNADMSAPVIHIDTNGNGDYDDGTDTVITYLDEIPADDTSPVTFFIVSDAPLTLQDKEVAGVSVTATVKSGGTASSEGAAITATPITDAFDRTAVQVVVANAASTVADAYEVASANVSVTKFITVINDPICASTQNDYRKAGGACVNDASYLPKAIPGATLEYSILVENDAAASASAKELVLTDDLNIDGSDTDPGNDLDIATISTPVVDVTNLATDNTTSNSISSGVLTVNFNEVAPGEDTTITFTIKLL